MPDGTPEIYLAVQGEGFTSGLPMVFVRTSNCNLGCQFCDTAYTWFFEGTKYPDDWNKNFKKFQAKLEQLIMTPEEVAAKIAEVAGNVHNAVFTGGEPTVQQTDLTEVAEILQKKYGGDWYFEVETNGSILLSERFDKCINQINCSPKLESSGNPKYLRDIEKPMRFIANKARFDKNVCYKFVVGKATLEADMKEIEELQERYKIPKESIYLMPEGTDSKEMIKSTLEMVEICKKTGYRLSTRVQVILYGPKRAV